MNTFLTQLFSTLSRPFQWWIVIAPWEAALRVRWGKHVKVLTPGIHLRVPFVDRIFAQSVRLRTMTETGITVTTKDGRTVVLAIGVEFRIGDILRVYQHLASPDMTVLARCNEAICNFAARHERAEVTATAVRRELSTVAPWDQWGLADVRVLVIGIAFAKPYRFLMNDYRSHTKLYDIEGDNEKGGLR